MQISLLFFENLNECYSYLARFTAYHLQRTNVHIFAARTKMYFFSLQPKYARHSETDIKRLIKKSRQVQ